MTVSSRSRVNGVCPHNLEAEKGVLGAILINNHAFTEAAEIIDAQDFYRDAHRRIFEKMVALTDRREPVDLITLKDELWRSGELDEVGGPAYIAGLTDGVPRSLNAEAYARVVKTTALTRKALDRLARARQQLHNGEFDAAHKSVQALLDDIPATKTAGSDVLVDDVKIMTLPPPSYFIEGVLSDGVSMVYGPSGIGKTFLQAGIGLSVASGEAWLGRRINRRGPVVYVAAEGSASLGVRIAGWKLAHDLAPDLLLGFHVWPKSVNLLDRSDVGEFIRAVRSVSPVITIIDTFARCLVGGDENSAKDVGLAVASLDRIRTELGAAVVVTHHTNKAESGERGSGALRAACDTVISLTKTDDVLRINCEKQKDAEPFAPVEVRLVQAYDGAKTCVIRLAHEVEPSAGLTDAQGRLLHVLREVFGSSGATSAEWQTATKEISERTFYRARKELGDRGFVQRDGKRFVWSGKPLPSTATPPPRHCEATANEVSR